MLDKQKISALSFSVLVIFMYYHNSTYISDLSKMIIIC